MTYNLSHSEPGSVSQALDELIQHALADGVHPVDLSTALTAAAVRIGLQMAPNAGIALAVVMKALSDIAGVWFATSTVSTRARDVPAVPPGTMLH
jgi:hypothetical protein